MARTRRLKRLFALLGAAFFFTPLVLLATGYRAHEFENHAFAPAPSLSQGWNLFNDATSFLIERLPLRQHAVNANTWLDLHVFNTTPQYGQNGIGGVGQDQALPGFGNPDQDKAKQSATTTKKPATGTTTVVQPLETENQVAVGTHGWYYLSGVFSRACYPFIAWSTAAARWGELVEAIRASGRKAIMVVPPDKSSVYPQYVAPSTPDLACSEPGETELWDAIDSRSSRAAGIVGLRSLLRAEARASPTLLYYKTDSHWNSLGSLSFDQAILPYFSPTIRLTSADIVRGKNYKYSGDLLTLLGLSGVSENAPSVTVVRKRGVPEINGPTVVVGDSYAQDAISQVQPFFRQKIGFLEWEENPETQIADEIADSRDVILETVEREFDYRASNGVYITPTFIALVKRTLAAHPLATVK
jgi:alginate O-acetyltransferase complex protein AlgJ